MLVIKRGTDVIDLNKKNNEQRRIQSAYILPVAHYPPRLVRRWEARRIIYTKDTLCIAFVGEDTVRDMVPLAEILHIEELSSEFAKELSAPATSNASESLSANSNSSFLFRSRSTRKVTRVVSTILQIVTKEKGYNSGRTYYLQPSTQQEQEHLLQELAKLSEVARKKAEGKTRFQNSQVRVDTRTDAQSLC